MCDYAGPIAGAVFIVLLVAAFALLGDGLSRHFRREGVKKALDPNTPPEELFNLAENHPEVLQNPVLPLLSIEDPLLWSQIEARAREAAARLREDRRAYYKDLFKRGLVFPAMMLSLLLLVWLLRSCA